MTNIEASKRLLPAKKKEAMPANARTVKSFLMLNNASTAVEIMHSVGFSHTDVYRALIWLESRSLAFVHVRYAGHRRLGGYWEAA